MVNFFSYGELLQFNSISGDTSVAGAAGNAGITSNYRVDNFCFSVSSACGSGVFTRMLSVND